MKKALLTKLMLLLCALIAGSSSVWADDVILTLDCATPAPTGSTSTSLDATAIATFLNSAAGLSTEENKITCSIKTGDVYSGKGSGGGSIPQQSLKVGKASAGGGFTFTIPNTYDNVDVVEITCYGWKTTSSISINSGTAQTFNTAQVETIKTFELASGTRTITIEVTTSAVCITRIVLKKKNANVVATPTINGDSPFVTSTEVTISCGTDGASIQYSTDNGANWNSYSNPFTLNETTTVKAKATKSGLTDSEVASQTFTKVTSMSVAAALTAINALEDNGTIADQCVAGIISQIDTYGSNAITYWISDDGTTTSQLEVYKGKGLYGANFTAISDLNVGDEVVVYGTLKKYNTTPEFDAGSQLLSYEATGAPTPVITASNVTIDSEATSGEITYTIDNPTAASLSAAEKEDYDWITGVNVDVVNNKVTFSVTPNTGEQRIGYITLSYEGATSKDVKITQKATYGTATLPFAFDSGKSAIATTDGLTHNGLGSDYSGSPLLKFDNADDYLILKINAAAEVVNFDLKGNGTNTDPWAGSFKIQTSADGVTYTDLQTYTDLTSDISHKSVSLTSSVRYIKWIYTTKITGNVALGRIGVDCEAVVIPEAGYATFCTPNKIDFAGTTGVKAYKVSAIESGYVTLEEVTTAPANTPVVLEATAGTYGLSLVASASEVTSNKLLVSDGNVTGGDGIYALAKKGNDVGFYKVKDTIKIPAGKCYLNTNTSAPEFLGFDFAKTTGINAVKELEFMINGKVYNLAGQRVAQPTKGLYIVNGKKVVIK